MQLLKGHTDVAHVLAFAPDGSLLASASADATVRVWSFPTGEVRAVLHGDRYLAPCLAFSHDARWLAAPASAEGVAAWVWDLTGRGRRIDLPLSAGDANVEQRSHAVAFTPDGEHLVVAGHRGQGPIFGRTYESPQIMVRRWRVGNWTQWTELPAADFDVLHPVRYWQRLWALTPHGAILATPEHHGVVFWDLPSGREVFHVQGENVSNPGALACSPDGSRFAIGRSRSVVVCDVPGQRVIVSWQHPTRNDVQSIAFAPDGRTLVTAGNDTAARLWDTETGCEKAAYGWEIGRLKAVAFAPDGMRAAASGKKGTIVVWDVE